MGPKHNHLYLGHKAPLLPRCVAPDHYPTLPEVIADALGAQVELVCARRPCNCGKAQQAGD